MSDALSTLPLRTWVDAWNDANHTFYTHHAPEQHFRTSIDASAAIARRIAALLAPAPEHSRPATDSSLPRCIVDIGSGSGALLTQLAALVVDIGRREATHTQFLHNPPTPGRCASSDSA